jgi:ubiquinone/menaquinone biosynthesis C-methylase UbiE
MKENATKTSALQKRISSQKNQTVNLNEWIFEKINVKKNPKILELCCGTGAQTKYLSKIMGTGSLDCVDVNQETIAENRNTVDKESINYHVSSIDEVDNYAPNSVDLIFAAYGFYYSEDPIALHSKLYKKLNRGGQFVLVGPVLGNNAELYEIMRQIGVQIPDNVFFSSEKFMLKMEALFLDYYDAVNFNRVLNRVEYQSCDDLLNYWRNTTFYDNSKDGEFLSAVSDFYKGNIVVTKSISYLEGCVASGT